MGPSKRKMRLGSSKFSELVWRYRTQRICEPKILKLRSSTYEKHQIWPCLLKKMWGLTLPAKVKIFAWLLITKRLHVRSRHNRFLPQINPECPLCQNCPKTIDHLFHTVSQMPLCHECMELCDNFTSLDE